MNKFYLTTPIYYVNANPHLGHAFTTIVADVATRFHRMMGEDAVFITGTDEHGDKIVQAAEKAGKAPEVFTTEVSNSFRALWPKLETAPHAFMRTTDPAHVKEVQAFLQRVYDSGDIYFGEYGGHYCLGCERFYTEKELENGMCPQHLTKPEYISEKNYFFRMSKYADWLKDHIRNNPDFIRPERYRTEALALLESGELEDLCISRPKSRLTWGIELPFDKDYVCYVWFDALLTYISALGGVESEGFAKYWPSAQHLVAKDILKPHAIFWPTMLKAANLPIYNHLNVHGYWLVRDMKMSKSIGNVVSPLGMAEQYGIDAFRYFLLREMHFGNDASFSEDALVARLNADLANDLGNLYSRVLAMTAKFCNSRVPAPGAFTPLEEDLVRLADDSMRNFQTLLGSMRFSQGIEALWELVRGLNKYVDTAAPWALAKNGETDRLHTVLYILLECMRKIALHVWPIMPGKAEAMLEQLGVPFAAAKANLQGEIGHFNGLVPGTEVAKNSNLFPRVELAAKEEAADPAPVQEKKAPAPKTKEAPKAAEAPATIQFDDFAKIDMRAGTVVACEPHPNADKLLRVLVDLGEEKPRQVLAGIAAYFAPQELVGKQVVVVANLAPRAMRGLDSHGMILAVKTEAGLELVTPGGVVPNGSKVS